LNNPLPPELIMFDVASIVLGDFQASLTSVFGNSIGWAIGHSIIFICFAAIFFGIRERDHIINNSGIGKRESVDFGVFVLLTLALYFIYTSAFDFASGASWGIAAASSLSIRWMVTVLG